MTMKIKEFMQILYDRADTDASHYRKTCDTLKAGDPEKELSRIAVSMFGTPRVIREAAEWGANLLIVHEPLYYDHWDSPETFQAQSGFLREILEKKKKLIEESGLTIYRYHDHPHFCPEDQICMGELLYSGLRGRLIKGEHYAVNRFELEEAMPLRELVRMLECNLKIEHIRISGADDFPVRRLGLCFGTPGHIEEELGLNDVVLTGEICEWQHGEFVRDCAGLGLKKAILVMGHNESERDGMRLLADQIREKDPFPVRYFESGPTYLYTDRG